VFCRRRVIEGEAKSEIGLQLRSANVKVVRSIFEHFSYDVLRIDRVSFAGLTKKNLPRGNWRLLTEQVNLKTFNTFSNYKYKSRFA
jgi:23S rRNA pseudouridine2605 synthase